MTDGKPMLSVVQMREHTRRDTSAMLRKVADQVDAGDYGEVGEIAFVIMGDKVSVFGFGPSQDGTSTATLLQAGAMRLIRAVERHGEPE